jgi:putative transcriptional regulator
MAISHIGSRSPMIPSKPDSLTGHFMVALPGFKEEDFREVVLLICQHDHNGAMGLVINQPISGVHLSDLVHQSTMLRHKMGADDPQDVPLFWGGPVDVNQGFVLHSPDVTWSTTIKINDGISITPHLDILEEVDGPTMYLPSSYRAMLGHVSWVAGQLEKEWMNQAWLSLPYQDSFLFDIDPHKQWTMMIAACGVQPMSLSPIQGCA